MVVVTGTSINGRVVNFWSSPIGFRDNVLLDHGTEFGEVWIVNDRTGENPVFTWSYITEKRCRTAIKCSSDVTSSMLLTCFGHTETAFRWTIEVTVETDSVLLHGSMAIRPRFHMSVAKFWLTLTWSRTVVTQAWNNAENGLAVTGSVITVWSNWYTCIHQKCLDYGNHLWSWNFLMSVIEMVIVAAFPATTEGRCQNKFISNLKIGVDRS